MSDADRRPCPRCETVVTVERLDGEDGVTWLWRCACGWAGARTDAEQAGRPASGVVSRRELSAEIARVLADRKKASEG